MKKFIGILILIKFFKSNEILNILNTSKIEVNNEVSISINIKGQKFNKITKKIFFNYFEEGKRDLLFNNYVIKKGKVLFIEEEKKYTVKNITYNHKLDQIIEFKLGEKELSFNCNSLFKYNNILNNKTKNKSTTTIKKPTEITKKPTKKRKYLIFKQQSLVCILSSSKKKLLSSITSILLQILPSSLESNSRINTLKELPLSTFVKKDNSLMSFPELNNLDDTFILERGSDLLDVATFYKKKYTLLKTKYKESIEIINNFNRLWTNIKD